jgi:hypothetical protein
MNTKIISIQVKRARCQKKFFILLFIITLINNKYQYIHKCNNIATVNAINLQLENL